MRSHAMSIIQKTFISEYIKMQSIQMPLPNFALNPLVMLHPSLSWGKGLTLKGAFLIVMDIFTVIGGLAVYFICLIRI